MKVCLFDPALKNNAGLPTTNLGDYIIQESVDAVIEELFPGAEVNRVSTHVHPGEDEMKMVRDSDVVLVGGSNLLGDLWITTQWKVRFLQRLRGLNAIMLGTGWRAYEPKKPSIKSRLFYPLTLSRKALHSVRDQYTADKMKLCGVSNCINTCCPTIWPLVSDQGASISAEKKNKVLFTITDYRRDPEADAGVFQCLKENYDQVYFWPQGKNDLDYFVGMKLDAEVLDRSFEALKEFVSAQSSSMDYIGTRLHCGIKCMCQGVRSLIIAVDNRAAEIGEDVSLPIANRGDLESVKHWIGNPEATKLKLDGEAISAWKMQFQTT